MSQFHWSFLLLPLPARRPLMDSTPLLSSGPERQTAAQIRLHQINPPVSSLPLLRLVRINCMGGKHEYGYKNMKEEFTYHQQIPS